MSYLDLGFDENLQISTPQQQSTLDPQAFDNFVDVIPGTKIQGGVISSPDGKTKFDLESGSFKVNNGVVDLITLGVLPDESIGFLVKDNQGNVLMQISSGLNIIKSKTGNFDIELDNARFVFYDDKRVPQGLFGEE